MTDSYNGAEKSANPSFATGKQMHEHIAIDRPPLEITLRGLSPKSQPRLSIDAALTKRPTSK